MLAIWLRKLFHATDSRPRRYRARLKRPPRTELLEDRIAPALVAAYSFNEGIGTTVNDVSGNGNHGTVSKTTWSNSGKFNKALSFNGNSSYVTISDSASLDLTSAMTIEAWVRPTANNGWRQIILKERPGGLSYALYGADSGLPGVFVSTATDSDQGYRARSPLAKNTWTHLAGTYDGSSIRLYVNGALSGTTTVTGSILTSTGSLRIGGNSVWGEWFSGLIDEVRVYNTALTPSEIKSDMNTAITVDTQAPTTPAGLSALAINGTQINLSWSASTDNIGVAAYLVERQSPGSANFIQIGTTSTTTFNDVGVSQFSAYSYRVRASDAVNNLSGYSNIASAQTPDALAPTTPTNLSSTPVSGTVINLNWTASADNVGVTNYIVERQSPGTGFVQIGTSATTTFSDVGLIQGTSYNYRVRATDAMNNLSGYSNESATTTLDTQPPTSPSGLSAMPTGDTQINLVWTASIDNVGVIYYQIERQGPGGLFEIVGTSTSTTFDDLGLLQNTSYSYRVRATDAANNLSDYSNIAVATTSGPDVDSPTAPSGLSATAISGVQINLSWTASSDNVGVAGYLIERQGPGGGAFSQIGTSAGTIYSDAGLATNSTYNYRVRAFDAASNLGGYSAVAFATTFAAFPGLVAAFSFNENTGAFVSDVSGLSNNGTTSNTNWAPGKFGSALSFNGTNSWVTINDANSLDLTNAMTLQAWVNPAATDSWRNVILKERPGGLSYGLYSSNNPNPGAFVSTNNGADFGPVAPSMLPINTWSHLAATYDGAAVTLYINGVVAGTQAATGNIISSNGSLRIGGNSIWGEWFNGLIDEVRIYDVVLTQAQIISDMATPIGGSGADTQVPTAPSNLSATAVSSSQVNLSWTASTDNVGVVGYTIERMNLGSTEFVQLATTTGTTFSDNGLAPISDYSYRVRAFDAAQNSSAYSNVASATTQSPDSMPPVVGVTGPTEDEYVSLSISVTADATDNVGVVGVQFRLDGVNLGNEDTEAPYSVTWDTSTSTRGKHTLTAIARDAAGNETVSAGRTVNVVPKLVITAPTNNATVSSSDVLVNYQTIGDVTGMAHIHFQLDGTAIDDLTIDGTFLISGVPVGFHTLSGYLSHSAEQLSGDTVTFNVSPADTTLPTVSMLTPTDGATVSGTIQLSASASDNVAVAGVTFVIDGKDFSGEDTIAPYVASWDTSSYTNGSHSISARVRDTSGNIGYANVLNVNVLNSADPALIGQWSPVMNWPLVAVNMVMLKNGKILMWDGGPACIGSKSVTVYDPVSDVFTPVPIPDPNNITDIFCTGMSSLADGRVLIVGGHECVEPNFTGQANAYVFNPDTLQWTVMLNALAYRRYYPTSTTLPDGRALITVGSDVTVNSYLSIPEIYDPLTNTFSTLPSGPSIANYPFMFVLPDGKIVAAGSAESAMATYVLDVNTQLWSMVDSQVLNAGSAVMYLPGKIMKSGSGYRVPDSVNLGPSAASTYVIDMNQGSPAWQQTSSMAYPRSQHNLTVLPDGNVMVIGGSTQINGFYPSDAVYPTELWSPITQTYTTMASIQQPRMYHSTVLLLPDGRLLSAGGGRNGVTDANYLDAQIYSPPYLFKGSRPTITSVPSTLEYNASFFVQTPDAANIASVALIRGGSVTHAFDMDQRFVPLNFTQGAGGLNVTAPADANYAPPGYYMLFLVNTNGVPSIAPMVRFAAAYEDSVLPSAPSDISAIGTIGTATLNWSASTDNVGIARYNVHRSTTSVFTPSTANRVGQSTSTTFVNTGLLAGTYYYRITAEDIAGNISNPSAEVSATVTSDTTLPSGSITSPTNLATVAGIVTIAADATDNVGVAGVQFLLDGSFLGAEDLNFPYSISWNSFGIANGNHSLTARVRDASGNVFDSTPVTVNVSNVTSSGLVLSIGFNEGSGSTVADQSGKGNNGTIFGPVWTTAGKFGNALSFDGVNDYINIEDADSLDLTNGMTLEAWVRPSAINSWRQVILKERPGGLAYALYSSNGPNPGTFVSTSSGSDLGPMAASTLPTNTWTFLAGTYDGTAVRLFINGIFTVSVPADGNILTTNGALRIGGNSVWGEWFSGIIDEIRVYNRALSEAEIQQDMDTPIGSPLNLLAGKSMTKPAAAIKPGQLSPLVNEAITRWTKARPNSNIGQRLQDVEFEIIDLPGTILGLASSTIIYIDSNAAGHGWFIDSTPWEDSEFAPGLKESSAHFHADVLTTLVHEMGHILGLDDEVNKDDHGANVMAGELPLGVRRVNLRDATRIIEDAESRKEPSLFSQTVFNVGDRTRSRKLIYLESLATLRPERNEFHNNFILDREPIRDGKSRTLPAVDMIATE